MGHPECQKLCDRFTRLSRPPVVNSAKNDFARRYALPECHAKIYWISRKVCGGYFLFKPQVPDVIVFSPKIERSRKVAKDNDV
jgi:hypothetical protein